jgi:hypothetical protein
LTNQPIKDRRLQVKIKTVAIEYTRKVNLGNFESAQLSCSLWAQIDEDDGGLDGAMTSLWQMAKENVRVQLLPLLKKNPNAMDVKEFFLGLPIAMDNGTFVNPETGEVLPAPTPVKRTQEDSDAN